MRLFLLGSLLLASTLPAQTGGNGSDGAFDAKASLTLDTSKKPEFNFKSFRIRKGVVVRVKGSKPFVVRCQGDVWIEGELNADGMPGGRTTGGTGGPGGFAGGDGHSGGGPAAKNGSGPCGGVAGKVVGGWEQKRGGGGGRHAGCYGKIYPFTLQGGSGGGGGWAKISWPTGAGGGGGVIVILADGKIRIDGLVTASGHAWLSPYFSQKQYSNGGGGAGGSILLRGIKGVASSPGSLILTEGSTTYLTKAPFDRSKPWPWRASNKGYVRFDTGIASLDIKGTVFGVQGKFQLPFQDIPTAPVQGKSWVLRVAAQPGDLAAVFWSWGLKELNVPPFGVLELDLGNGFIFAGALAISKTGVDPFGTSTFFAYKDKSLLGRKLHAQSLTLGLTGGKPLLTNLSSTVIR